jgi:microcystin-dependent protein
MDAFLGEIRLMGFPFAPKGWAYCQGQLLSVPQNAALFSLLGTTYGGDGRTTFGLPDLRGRVIIGAGTGPGLSSHSIGQQGGQESVTLTLDQAPAHGHSFSGTIQTGGGAEFNSPANNFPAEGSATQFASGTPTVPLALGTLVGQLSPVGGQAHENRQPTLVLNYAIATQGYFPSRG